MNWYTEKKITLRDKRETIKKIVVSRSFRVALGVFIVVFTFLYVWQTNSVSTKGYALADMDRQVTQLERENRSLQVEIAKYGSMQSINERLKETNLVMIDVAEADYLTNVGRTVAQR